jgi:hypothetical protein
MFRVEGCLVIKTAVLAFLISVAAVAALQPVYFFSLAALDTIAPREARRAHLAQAFENGVLAANMRPTRWFQGGGDQFTECIAQAAGLNPEENRIDAAMIVSRPFLFGQSEGGQDEPCAALEDFVAGKAPVSWHSYFRYWHGYRVYQATMLAWMPLWLVRVVNAALLLSIVIFFCVQVQRLCGPTVALALILPALVLSDLWRLWRISPHFVSVGWILLGAALFALCRRKGAGPVALAVLATVIGSVFNFLDLLTSPPWQPMLLGFFMLLPPVLAAPHGVGRRAHYRNATLLAGLIVLAWFGGYGLTWLSKWIATALIYGDGGAIRDRVIGEMFWWTAADHPGVVHAPIISTLRLLLRPFERFGGAIIVAALAAWIYHRARLTKRPVDWAGFWLLCSPSLVLAIWGEILRNHTQFHLSVTSRSSAAAVGIVFAAWVVALRARPEISALAPELAASIRGKLRWGAKQ